MKHFLHWSSAIAGGVLTAFVGEAYGLAGYVFSLIAVVYIGCSQWLEGRNYS